MLAGDWYARACGLEPVLEDGKAVSAMATVYEFNVAGFCGGRRGAVNGMRPNGRVDTTSMQSSEERHGAPDHARP